MAKAGTKYSALGTKPEARETNGTRKWEGGAAAGQFPTERSRATDCARRVDNKSGGTRPHSPRARRPKSPKMSREATRIRGGRERRFRNPQNADRRGEIRRLQMAVAVWPPAPARPRRLHRRRHPARSKSRRFALCGIDRIGVIKKSSEWAEYQNNLGFMRRRDSS